MIVEDACRVGCRARCGMQATSLSCESDEAASETGTRVASLRRHGCRIFTRLPPTLTPDATLAALVSFVDARRIPVGHDFRH